MQHVAPKLLGLVKNRIEQAIAGALHEVDARDHRVAVESRKIECERVVEQPVDHQDMLRRVKRGAGRRDGLRSAVRSG